MLSSGTGQSLTEGVGSLWQVCQGVSLVEPRPWGAACGLLNIGPLQVQIVIMMAKAATRPMGLHIAPLLRGAFQSWSKAAQLI